MSSGRILGVDACRGGWVGIALGDSHIRPYVAPTIRELAGQAAADGPPQVIAIDIPIGLADTGRRRADQLAREALGRRWPSLFITPVRESVQAGDFPSALAANRRLAGEGISRQAFALRAKILDVDEWLRGCPPSARVVEAHPELSFAQLAGAPLALRKSTWAGAEGAASCSPRPGSPWPRTSARPGSRRAWTTCSTRPPRPGPPCGSAGARRAASPTRPRRSATGCPLPSGPEPSGRSPWA